MIAGQRRFQYFDQFSKVFFVIAPEINRFAVHRLTNLFGTGRADRPVRLVKIDTGFLEDRRPAANADPYRVTARIIETLREAHEKAR